MRILRFIVEFFHPRHEVKVDLRSRVFPHRLFNVLRKEVEDRRQVVISDNRIIASEFLERTVESSFAFQKLRCADFKVFVLEFSFSKPAPKLVLDGLTLDPFSGL